VSVALITGSGGLIGSEASRHFAELGMDVVGIDNDMRRTFFGEEASTAWNVRRLQRSLGRRYRHHDLDVRDRGAVAALARRYGRDVALVIHAAAQPSHDWAARDPFTDFDVNAGGTLAVLEATRRHCPDAVFVFTSTNKVYGDAPNRLPLVELDTRYEIDPDHTYAGGIREDMPIDRSLHSVFGASKVAADVMVQEYGRYFGMPTVCFRGGTLTGPSHSATELHGFLAYVVRCAMTGTPYRVFGYKGKQVRDAIHSNDSNCSVLEAIELTQAVTGRAIRWDYVGENRVGDHVWWIGDNGRFASHYPGWRIEHDVARIVGEIHEANRDRWVA
jgi:CDP-paratose 2-epimerase